MGSWSLRSRSLELPSNILSRLTITCSTSSSMASGSNSELTIKATRISIIKRRLRELSSLMVSRRILSKKKAIGRTKAAAIWAAEVINSAVKTMIMVTVVIRKATQMLTLIGKGRASQTWTSKRTTCGVMSEKLKIPQVTTMKTLGRNLMIVILLINRMRIDRGLEIPPVVDHSTLGHTMNINQGWLLKRLGILTNLITWTIC